MTSRFDSSETAGRALIEQLMFEHDNPKQIKTIVDKFNAEHKENLSAQVVDGTNVTIKDLKRGETRTYQIEVDFGDLPEQIMMEGVFQSPNCS